ncbi:hypothetical protein AB0K52_16580 [Glycomyces sp. NPDC049804]|uniref:hypothetical protein n=1 Tax=Glycomyces sp. NPDC049804 TaxID=3154363 RepID=UPI0034216634
MLGESPVARFCDQLAADYHLFYADWDVSMGRQGRALDAVIRAESSEDTGFFQPVLTARA